MSERPIPLRPLQDARERQRKHRQELQKTLAMLTEMADAGELAGLVVAYRDATGAEAVAMAGTYADDLADTLEAAATIGRLTAGTRDRQQ